MVNIISGEIGAGKSTYIQKKIIDANKNLIFNGYLTERIYLSNLPQTREYTAGFCFKTFNDKTFVFAHRYDKISDLKVRDYWISKQAYLDILNEINSIKKYDILIIDELGFFELDFDEFKNGIKQIIDDSKLAYVVIQKRVLEKWLEFLEISDKKLMSFI